MIIKYLVFTLAMASLWLYMCLCYLQFTKSVPNNIYQNLKTKLNTQCIYVNENLQA